MTENEREEVGCVQKNEASPVLALMVQMRLGERMRVCVVTEGERERGSGDAGRVGLKGFEPGD